MKFIQISDVHIAAAGEQLYGLFPEERLQLCIRDINEQHGDAEFAIITGDLAHRGEARAYQRLTELLAELRMPVHLLIGNHDSREGFQAAFPSAPRDDHGFVQFCVETPVGRFIALDTNQPGAHYGRLCERRQAWLEARLGECAGRAAYLFMHHAPMHVGLREMDVISLRDGERLAEIVTAAGNVRHIFFGHLHRPLSGSWHGVPFNTMPATSHQVALDFELEHVVPGSHEPPAYAVVFVSPAGTLVHLRNFLDTTATFNL
jgi:3',5'-cyclic-AMP phosphodiesterase